MKIPFFILCIIFSFFGSASTSFALSYKEPFPKNQQEFLSEENIAQAKLLESYITRYSEKIEQIYWKYSREKSPVLNEALTVLNLMKSALQKAQKNPLEEDDFVSLNKSIVTDLQTLNERMQVYLEQQKTIYEKKIEDKKQYYIKIGTKISALLDNFIESISSHILKKKTITQKDREVIRILLEIREQNERIKGFSGKNFSSTADMKLYYIKIIDTLRKDIGLLRTTLRH